MADSSAIASTDAKPAPPRFRHGSRAGLVRALVINLCVLLIPVGAYYALVVLHYEQYRHERSFRALAEHAAQFDAKAWSVVEMFRNAPRAKPSVKTDDLALPIYEFRKRIADPSWFVRAREYRLTEGNPCTTVKKIVPVLRIDEPPSRIEFIDCNAEPSRVTIFTPVESLLDAGATRLEFEHLLLSTARGEVIADLTPDDVRRDDPHATRAIADITPTRVRTLLETIAASERKDAGTPAKTGKTDDKDKKDAPSPDAPVMLDAAWHGTFVSGAQTYAAYVLPHAPAPGIYRTCGDDKLRGSDTLCLAPEPMLYLVGLTRANARDAARQSMNPAGLLALLTALGCTIALWPALRLRFLEPHDSLGWRTVRLLGAGTLVAMVLLCATGQAFALRQQLFDAAQTAARMLAVSIADRFMQDIYAQARRVTIEPPFEQGDIQPCETGKASGRTTADDIAVYQYVGKRLPDDVSLIASIGPEGMFTGLAGVPTSDKERSSFVVNTDCRSAGSAGQLRLDGRPYFRAARNDPWCLPDAVGEAPRHDCEHHFAMSRLFGIADGAKATTIAVRRDGERGAFGGITFVDSRLLAYTSAVMPYHFQFAVFDEATGTTIYHSDDARALSENFLAETERPAELLAAIERRGEVTFSGTYRGAATYFAAQPLAPMRWTLVVYFSTSPIELVVLYAQANAVFATLLPLLAGLALAAFAVRVCGGTMLWLWPQWRLRRAYASAVVATALIGTICVLAAQAPGTAAAAAIVLLPIALATLFSAIFDAGSVALDCDRSWQWLQQVTGMTVHVRRRQALVAIHLVAVGSIVALSTMAGKLTFGVVFILAAGHAVAFARAYQRGAPKRRRRLIAPGPARDGDPWRHDIALDPKRLQLDTLTGSWARRHLVFVAALTLAVSALPVALVFDDGAAWQLEAATLSAAHASAAQFDARVRRMRADAEGTRGRPGPAGPDDQLAPALGVGHGGFTAGTAPWRSSRGDAQRPTLDACPNASDDTAYSPPYANWPTAFWQRFAAQYASLWLHAGATDDDSPTGAWRRVEGPAPETQIVLRHASDTGEWCVRYPRLTSDHLATVAATVIPKPGGRDRANAPETRALAPTNASIVLAATAAVVVLLLLALLRFIAHRVFGRPASLSTLFGASPPPADDAARCVLAVRVDAVIEREVLGGDAGDVVDLAAVPIGDIARRLYAGGGPLLLRRLDVAMLDPTRRAALLEPLERLAERAARSVCISVQTTPLYRLCHPLAYDDVGRPADVAEQVRWLALFTRFEKRYGNVDGGAADVGIAPADDQTASTPYRCRLDALLAREARPLWPALQPIAQRLRALAGHDGTPPVAERDIVEYFALHGDAHYRAAWEACTRNERLALYQLARGRLVNVENLDTIEHLRRRRLIVFEPHARIASQSFAGFVRNAEPPGTFERWEAEASEGLWQSIRMPLTIVLLLVLVWIAYSSGETLNVVVTLVGTALTFVGTLLRAVNFAKSGPGAEAAAPPRK